ncbi:conserved hypothetical protein [Paraburkholderia piptadeniae]|uniref:Uncharacterized protein n=1 Tax=Paraburkholderia piptadeniae TaxID=1701573 RepID=A0A1N7SVN6_9BURK|nr:hypothetical protein [Paraburkholderia piptadeniae]SIT51536.1 conserved hypothetical protein [Paraburkholderia piptadeniae]
MILEDEMRDLRLADNAIAAARSRIGRQLELLQVLERDGHDTELAEKLLAEMRRTLQTMIEHRAIIATAIGSIKSKKP